MLGLSSWASAVSGCAALGALLLAELSRHHRSKSGTFKRAAGLLAALSLGGLVVLAAIGLIWG